MNSNINLSKVKPCMQNWDAMERCGEGRLCSKCNEIITDFRGMTNWEIALIHSGSKKRVCGIYDPKRLDKNSRIRNFETGKKKAFFAGFLGLLSTCTTIYGQHIIPRSDIELTHDHGDYNFLNNKAINQEERTSDVNEIDSIRIIRGVIRDENQEPLMGANVIIDGTSKGTVAELGGAFVIDLTKEFERTDIITLVISYTGFGRMEKEVSKNDFVSNNELRLDLILNYDFNMEVFGVKRAPFYKRIWYGIRNVFRKKN